jgi:anionic cell wall polymer biosynthesis LytR-Cps2A-Psr (LCP) family protein
MSVKTVEDLLDIDINYYAKVNFTSLISLVDTLGGIEVNTDEGFRAYYVEDEVVDYTFKTGINKLNGKQALAYSRERKSLTTGDIARTKHQQQVLEGIINKAMSKTIITKYNDILNSLEDKFVTSIGTKNITKFIKNQIKNNPSWSINSNTLTGTSAYDYTYSYKSAKSYVMVPDEDSITSAKEQIRELLEEE